jgi:type III pantothenate kinase
MLLAVDIGNSQSVVGLFDGDTIVRQWRITSQASRTADECQLLVSSMLREAGIDPTRIGRMAMASVVPSLTPEFRTMGERLFGVAPLTIDGSIDTGVPLLVHDPSSVGPDRIVNVVAARARHGVPAIVIDMGTATTFDVLDASGNYLGGAIAPGVQVAAEALFVRGARLARVELKRPAQAIGKTTEEHLQSGIFFGAVGQIDEIVRRIAEEMGGRPRVIATGGLAGPIGAASSTIQNVDPDLTLHGIRLVEERISGGDTV